MSYDLYEKTFSWDESKNELLKKTRNLSFEDIVLQIVGENLLRIINHPSPERYPGQKIFVIRINDRVVLVPFVEDERKVYLKTIIPSRKMTKIYLGEKKLET